MQQPVLPHAPHQSQNSIGQPRMEPPKRNIPSGPGQNPIYVMSARQEINYRQSPSPSCPPRQQQQQQQRQGVIHHANTSRTLIVLFALSLIELGQYFIRNNKIQLSCLI